MNNYNHKLFNFFNMGACNSTTNKKTKTVSNTPSEHSAYILKFEKEIKYNHFYTMAEKTKMELISQYENSNLGGPNNFINNNNKYTAVFKKQFSLAYLKCIPLLNNITSDEKEANLLFLNIAIHMLSHTKAIETKVEIAQKLILESFDHTHKKQNIGRLKNIFYYLIKSAAIIVIYFGGLFLFLDEQIKKRVFEGVDLVDIEGKYDYSQLDDYFFTKLKVINPKMNEDSYFSIWEEFLAVPLNDINSGGSADQADHIKNYDNIFYLLSEDIKSQLRYRLCHMFDPHTFFESFLTLRVPKFDLNYYRQEN